jgi:hypothetical protein
MRRFILKALITVGIVFVFFNVARLVVWLELMDWKLFAICMIVVWSLEMADILLENLKFEKDESK